jgi:hypothetical protein
MHYISCARFQTVTNPYLNINIEELTHMSKLTRTIRKWYWYLFEIIFIVLQEIFKLSVFKRINYFHEYTVYQIPRRLAVNRKWPIAVRRVWRYQKGNQNPQIEEGQKIQWPKGKTTIYKTLHRKLKIE